MFVDRVKIQCTAGGGGDGCMSFLREKFVPLGGPNGGDGGKGGDVILVADDQLSTLLDLRYRPQLKGERGVHGKGSSMHGKAGKDYTVPVPCGSIVRDVESGEILCDMCEPGQVFIAARGGKGGKGNARFVTSTNRAPKFAEKGEPGEDRELLIELKLIAEVGLVGFPNAGKSTFLASVSAATPKIAGYPFTTLEPNLGVVSLSDYRSLTIADIPGIIEGAAEGKGLGHDFLRHVERNRVLLFIIDLGDEDPVHTHKILEEELRQFSDLLANLPRVVAFNKSDVTENQERFKKIKKKFKNSFLISGVTGDGIPELLEALWLKVEKSKQDEADIEVEEEPEKEYIYNAPFTIEHENGGYRVEGDKIVRQLRMTDFENPEAVRHLQRVITKMGLLRSLKRMGAKAGAPIFIDDMELEYQPE